MNTTQLLLSGAWTQGLQLFAALSLLIIIHEGGHFVFAKLCKTRVEKFYLFFDFLFPFSGLLNFSLFKKKKGDTEYGIGWFPLGGYVKIAGANGVVIPSGTNFDLPASPQAGMIRYNTYYQYVEVYDASLGWINSAGTSAGISLLQATDLGIVSALLFG